MHTALLGNMIIGGELSAARQHQTRVKLLGRKRYLLYLAAILSVAAGTGCIKVKQDRPTARLLKVDNATHEQLMNEVNRFASVESIRARMDLKFEDNSFAEFGSKEVYRQADGEVVVQRPGKILLKVQVPIIKSDVAQMTSDGETFRVAILQDGGSGKYKKFLKGTNAADYSSLERSLEAEIDRDPKVSKEGVNAFKNIRPQHFTDALLVRPTVPDGLYLTSTTYQLEEDEKVDAKSPLRKVMRGYYLLDEYQQTAGTQMVIKRRFWFDRVGGIRLARQQIFDKNGEIESDIVYGPEGDLAANGEHKDLPLQITVTRPIERYSMKLTYQTPTNVMIGNRFPDAAFVLQNTWGLEEVDLDKRPNETSSPARGSTTRP